MATQEPPKGGELEKLQDNLLKIEDLSQRLVAAIARRPAADHGLQGPGPELFTKATTAYFAEMMANPAKIIEHQVSYWGKAVSNFVEANQALASGQFSLSEPDEDETDKRFSNPLWQTHPYFNFIKRQYQLSSQALEEAVQDLDELDEDEQRRVRFFSQQIIDLMSPTNFLATNPDALERAVETEGESLVHGLENLVQDLEANDGDLLVNLVDKDAFRVGGNIATTPGRVVFRNRMMELIQYAPQTEQVKALPVVLFPPWINKYYILDLKEKNSLVNWIVGQGYTLFVVSWVNPDASYADVSLDTYVEEGYLAAIEAAKTATGQDQVNAVGYCIGGTTLALTLALLNKRKDKSIRSATFYTTMTDFEDQGEMGVFLNNDFVDGIERQVAQDGIMKSFFMARTFSYLRSNDLIYSPAIKSYMMGEAPPAFDLLYWNGDGTNLPGKMAVQYLRDLCQDNLFAKGRMQLCGETLGLKDVTVPLCAITCETDHIAAWDASLKGIRQMGSRSKTFIMSESGHIAGIINPPSKKKYGHYEKEGALCAADEWRACATYTEGSWWPRWEKWLRGKSGKTVDARIPGDHGLKALDDAPGRYVLGEIIH